MRSVRFWVSFLANDHSTTFWFRFVSFYFVKFSLVWFVCVCRLFNAKSILYIKTVLFQTIQFSIGTIWPIDMTLSGATALGHSGPGSNGNEGLLCIPQSFSITRNSPSDCLELYPGHTSVGVLPHCRKAVCVFYTPNRLGHRTLVGWVGVWPLCRDAVGIFYSPPPPQLYNREIKQNFPEILTPSIT